MLIVNSCELPVTLIFETIGNSANPIEISRVFNDMVYSICGVLTERQNALHPNGLGRSFLRVLRFTERVLKGNNVRDIGRHNVQVICANQRIPIKDIIPSEKVFKVIYRH